jgi:predicted transcriptional regulator
LNPKKFQSESSRFRCSKHMVRQSLWLTPETLDALKKIGQREDRPVGWLIRKAVEEFVERQKSESREKGR